MSDTIIVIGGGFAGAAAAAMLRAHGATVTLLEARPTLGGRARSDVLDGVSFDAGAQLITSSFARTHRLISTPMHRVTTGDAVVRRGTRLPLRFGSVRSLLAFSGMTPLEKLRVGAHLVPLLARHHSTLDADATRLPAALDTMSARAFVEQHVGAQAADTLVEPLCNGFYGVHGADVSLAFFLTLGRYGSDGDVLAPSHGWSAAIDAMLRDVDVIRDARASTLRFTVAAQRVAVVAADGRTWHADAVVVATGPRAAARLLAPHRKADDPLVAWLAGVALRATFTLAFALDVSAPRDAVGIYPDVHEARTVSACVVQGAKTNAPSDRDVVLAWPTPDALDTLRDRAADEIAAAMLPDVERLIPEVRGHVTRARVYRFDEGSPVASPGFVADRAHGRALADALDLPVALAGDYLTTPLIEGAVASGEHAAGRTMSRLRRA